MATQHSALSTQHSRRPKTTGQVRAMFGLAKERGLDNEALHEVVADVLLRIHSRSDRAGRAMKPVSGGNREQGNPVATAIDSQKPASIKALTYAEAEAVIQRLKGDSFVPRRTLQWRRQKAGIKQVVTAESLKKIAELASQREGWTAESLVKLCQKVIKRDRPATTEQANKIIEALKAMNRRDNLWAA